MKVERVLIATDGSASSVKVIEFGFGLAKDLNASVLLLGVVSVLSTLGNPDAGIFPDDALTDAENKVSAHLVEMKSKYAGKTDTLLLSKDAEISAAIAEAALNWNASLVIVGTYSPKGPSGLFHSNIAENVLKLSQVPVCVVPVKT